MIQSGPKNIAELLIRSVIVRNSNRDKKLHDALEKLKKYTCAICEKGFNTHEDRHISRTAQQQFCCGDCSSLVCNRIGCVTISRYGGAYCTNCKHNWCRFCGNLMEYFYNTRCAECDCLMCRDCISENYTRYCRECRG